MLSAKHKNTAMKRTKLLTFLPTKAKRLCFRHNITHFSSPSLTHQIIRCIQTKPTQHATRGPHHPPHRQNVINVCW